MCFAFISARWEFYTLRLLLGVAESAAFPGAWYLTSCCIPNEHLTVALGVIELSILVSLTVSAPFALAVFQLDGVLGLFDWQWLFLAEGLPPIMVGLYMQMFLPS